MAELEDKLLAIYHIVTDWLKYTEAKHAGLLLVSAAGPAAILTVLYSSSPTVTANLKGYLLASLFFFLAAGAISLLSFLPRVNRSHWLGLIWGWGSKESSDNLYYFGDLAKYDPVDLVTTISNKYGLDQMDQSQKQAIDLCDQIVINSRIVRVKLRLFTCALTLILIAIMILMIKLLVEFVN